MKIKTTRLILIQKYKNQKILKKTKKTKYETYQYQL